MRFEVLKNDLPSHRWIAHDQRNLSTGEIRLQVESYALTANNITYAVVGEKLGYWQFYPARTENWGCIPVWGFAKVIESVNENIDIGKKYYGYWPMDRECILFSDKSFEDGFMVSSLPRRNLPGVYNLYTETKKDIAYHPKFEYFQSLYRPLFATSFLLFHHLLDMEFLNADQIIITSASSKTALSLAYLLKARTNGKISSVAISSSGNYAFLNGTQLYNQIFSYDEIDKIDVKNSIIVDFRGNAKLLNALADRLSDKRLYSFLVGLTDWQNDVSLESRERASFFFAPDHASMRTKEWGRMQFQQRLADDLYSLAESAEGWTNYRIIRDSESLEQEYLKLLHGKIKPEDALIVLNE